MASLYGIMRIGTFDLMIGTKVKNLCRHPALSPLVGENETVDTDQQGDELEPESGTRPRAIVQYFPTASLPLSVPEGSPAIWMILGENISNWSE